MSWRESSDYCYPCIHAMWGLRGTRPPVVDKTPTPPNAVSAVAKVRCEEGLGDRCMSNAPLITDHEHCLCWLLPPNERSWFELDPVVGAGRLEAQGG